MLNDVIFDAIDAVESVSDFNALLYKWTMSEASQELKDEAIRELKARKSIFYINPLRTPKNVFEDIKAGQADIDDLA
jgi:hypothetical protein